MAFVPPPVETMDRPAPPAGAVDALRAAPHMARHFDARFGKGAAHRALGVKFVMCPPRYLSTKIANNKFMHNQPVNVDRAMKQYARIVRLLRGLDVPVLEIPPVKGCQDQTYTANIAVAIDPKIVLAKYKAEGRSCEEEPARKFFEQLGYTVIQPPTFFEGEADFKRWKPGVYFGGWGKFTDRTTGPWIAKQTGCEVIPLRMTSDDLYHLDCVIAVLDEETFLVNPAGLDRPSLRELEKRGNVIVVPRNVMNTGATNIVQIPGRKIVLSGMFFPEAEKYREGMEWMLKTFDERETTVLFMDIDEGDKSGADISCMVMHLDF